MQTCLHFDNDQMCYLKCSFAFRLMVPERCKVITSALNILLPVEKLLLYFPQIWS